MTFAAYPSLRDRAVLITGGATGIGADLVRAFAGQAARVAFLDIQDEAAEALVAELHGAPHRPVALSCDITDIEALRAAIVVARAAIGPISVLVNNAADDRRHPIDALEPEDWDRAQNINIRPHYFTAQAVHPDMQALGGGSIINFSSIAWRFGAGDMAAYVTAKAAVTGLTGALARAYGPDGIRVNAIEPGAVMTEKQLRLWYPTEESVQAMIDRQCIPRLLVGEEIARAALFLAADDSRMITKQTIVVDAGLR
ncbi:SDR family NAD(P)-dependent oxidoreductase [Amaricoccus sp.]|uniref:SDR family NAD(P)-dependent oxidoreductase n=1 Tax=Amaricoccus sp. TaxID=1872485 RepID=UPI001B500980|nr:SDR family oxidoreductase [Amaricoccus sp.]MBP7000883.1 SDR family oxidoreductase [Amaricoccus sp.]